jgi:hypothetical protein
MSIFGAESTPATFLFGKIRFNRDGRGMRPEAAD